MAPTGLDTAIEQKLRKANQLRTQIVDHLRQAQALEAQLADVLRVGAAAVAKANAALQDAGLMIGPDGTIQPIPKA